MSRTARPPRRLFRNRPALELAPAPPAIDPGPLLRRCDAAIRCGEHEKALAIAQQVLALDPTQRAAQVMAARACDGLGMLDRALHHMNLAISMVPESHPDVPLYRIWCAAKMLESGDFAAWPEYVSRNAGVLRKKYPLPDIPKPIWDGSNLAGKAIVLSTGHEGHGDAFMYSRYIPHVKALGGLVYLACEAIQARLFAESGLPDLVLPNWAPLPPEAWTTRPYYRESDCWAPLMDLPLIIGTTLPTIPREIPYLSATTEVIERWRPVIEAIPGKIRIGIAWQGNPNQANDGNRSFALREFAPLAAISGVSLVNLQKGPPRDLIPSCGFPVTSLGREYGQGDWLETAGVIHHLDLVISPDSSIAHLAGALGKAAWTALSRPAEWRWMQEGESSVWYPGVMKLWRQERPGDWKPVFERMAVALRQRLAGSP
jgi:hypothetical protein